MAIKKTKDQISIDFFGKPFKDISIYEAMHVNSEFNQPGSVAPGMKKKR